MKFWLGKKATSTEDTAMMNAVPLPPASGAQSAAPAPTASTASSAAPKPETAPFVIKPPTPQPLGAGREKTRVPNERRDLYYHLMNSLYDAVLVLDENGHIVDCNERTESVLDYTKDDLWDTPIATVIPAIDPRVFNQMKEGLHGRRRVLVNARCHRKDGSRFPAEVGAGLMTLIGENLVLTIRNIEKRLPARAIFKPTVGTDAPAS